MMIKCNKCGYENNDGSRVCLHCRENLYDGNSNSSDSERHTYLRDKLVSDIDQVENKSKRTLVVCVIAILVFVIGVVIYFNSLYKPVVDNMLLGTWGFSGYGHADTWTFEKDGSYNMTRTYSNETMLGIDYDGYYRAENGILKTSFSKNVSDYTTATYEYKIGFSENGTQCLILTYIQSGGGKSTDILYKID